MKIASKISQILYKFLKLEKVEGILNVYHYVTTATGSKRGLCVPAVASTSMKSSEVHTIADIQAVVGVPAVVKL
jgi:hypothetical protein